MGKHFLIRNVPKYISSWIEEQRGRGNLTQQEVLLGVLQRAYRSTESAYLPLFEKTSEVVVEKPVPHFVPFKFTDIFAGIGGFRIALEKLGGNCVFSCEWDKYSTRTYRAWFGDMPADDFRKVIPRNIPDHDVLTAGFPCQPFSIAGVSKKKSLGRAHGFKCANQGNLFFYLATLVRVKRPPVLFLENVKNLMSHDKGQTWAVILGTLEDLGYRVFSRIIDAAHWVPQHRERIYIVCFDRRVFGEDPPFEFPPNPQGHRPRLGDILEPFVESKYTLSAHLWDYLRKYAERQKLKGNGFGYGLAKFDGVARTLSARYYKDGSEILIPQKGKSPRRLTPVECARLMGFDDRKYKIVVSDTQAYRQFGNAVVPVVVEAIARQILKVLTWQLVRTGNRCLLKREALSPAQS